MYLRQFPVLPMSNSKKSVNVRAPGLKTDCFGKIKLSSVKRVKYFVVNKAFKRFTH